MGHDVGVVEDFPRKNPMPGLTPASPRPDPSFTRCVGRSSCYDLERSLLSRALTPIEYRSE